MYTCACGSNKFAISKALLTYLNYDIQEFAVEVLKYGPCTDSIHFFIKIFFIIELLHWHHEHPQQSQVDGRTQQWANFNSKIYGAEYLPLQGRNSQQKSCFKYLTQIKTYCDSSITFLTPSCFVHKIDKIHYKRDEVGGKLLGYEQKMMEV